MPMRFIAGAICPACGARDALKMDTSAPESAQYRECVDCGFSEETDATAEEAPRATVGRFGNDTAASDPEQPQVLRILPGTGDKIH